ncbi:unnamed protein product [Prunus armeniaca]
MCAAEMLGMFVHILGHGIGNRLAQERFQHSGETDCIGAIDGAQELETLRNKIAASLMHASS